MATPGIAIPGTTVPVNSAVGSSGSQGIQGIQGPTGVSLDSGNAAKLGSDSLLYVPQTFSKYYGTDSTNNQNLIVTVDNSFQLLPGVVVYVTPGVSLIASPTLNVNGSGAMPLVNRAAVTLLATEVAAGRIFGAMYDGANWRIITPLGRVFTGANAAGGVFQVECNGFDWVSVYVSNNTSAMGINLNHIAQGVHVCIDIANTYTAAQSYWVNFSIGPTGASITNSSYFIWTAATGGAALQQIGSSASVGTFNSNMHLLMNGMVIGSASLFVK